MSIWVGRLSYDARERDIEDLFHKFGRIRRIELKKGFAFVEFEDERDGEDALHELDGVDFLGNRIVIERARGRRRGPSSADRCFRCGREGHWARECRFSPNRNWRSPPPRRRRFSRSRSPPPRRRYSRSRSPRSRSPQRRRSPPPQMRRGASRSPPPRSPRSRSPPTRSPRNRSPPPRSPRNRSPPPRSPRSRSPPARSPIRNDGGSPNGHLPRNDN